MEKNKEKIEKSSIFQGIESFSEFIIEYKNQFEKRKYFSIDEDFKINFKKPSYVLELAYTYFKNENIEKTRIEEAIKNELLDVFKAKDKKINRLSKVEENKLSESFFRAILNKDSVHSVKLGNGLFYKNSEKLFEIMYNFSLISADENKLIKTFFAEKMLEEIDKKYKKYSEKYEFVEQILKNVINYFVKSDSKFINFDDSNTKEYFEKNNVNALYKQIYNKYFDKILEKYDIKSKKEFQFEILDEEKENLSISEKLLFENI